MSRDSINQISKKANDTEKNYSGYKTIDRIFDDAAEKPWGEYLKGFLDFVVSIVVAVVYLHYNSSSIVIAITGQVIVQAGLSALLIYEVLKFCRISDGEAGFRQNEKVFVPDTQIIEVIIIEE